MGLVPMRTKPEDIELIQQMCKTLQEFLTKVYRKEVDGIVLKLIDQVTANTKNENEIRVYYYSRLKFKVPSVLNPDNFVPCQFEMRGQSEQKDIERYLGAISRSIDLDRIFEHSATTVSHSHIRRFIACRQT